MFFSDISVITPAPCSMPLSNPPISNNLSFFIAKQAGIANIVSTSLDSIGVKPQSILYDSTLLPFEDHNCVFNLCPAGETIEFGFSSNSFITSNTQLSLNLEHWFINISVSDDVLFIALFHDLARPILLLLVNSSNWLFISPAPSLHIKISDNKSAGTVFSIPSIVC